jgi:hypothetical protein
VLYIVVCNYVLPPGDNPNAVNKMMMIIMIIIIIYGLYSFLTSVPHGDEWSASRRDRFYPVEGNLVSLEYENGRTPEAVWTLLRREKLLVPARSRSPNHPARNPY